MPKKNEELPVEITFGSSLAREVVIDLLRSDLPGAAKALKGLRHIAIEMELSIDADDIEAAKVHGLLRYDEVLEVWEPTELGTSVARYIATPVDALPREYLAMFPNYWGSGESSDEAIAAAKKQGGRGPHYVVYRIPPGGIAPFVNQMGNSIMWTWHPSATDEHRSVDAEIVINKMPQRAGTATRSG